MKTVVGFKDNDDDDDDDNNNNNDFGRILGGVTVGLELKGNSNRCKILSKAYSVVFTTKNNSKTTNNNKTTTTNTLKVPIILLLNI